MVESLKHRMQDTTQFIETVWSKFESRMRYLKYVLTLQCCPLYLILNRGLRAKTLESNDGSFILQEMIPAYRAAASFEGKPY